MRSSSSIDRPLASMLLNSTNDASNKDVANSCASYATVTGGEVKRLFDHKEDVEFGAEFLYSFCNNGRDDGSMLDANMKKFLEVGCCLRDSIPFQSISLNDLSMEQRRFALQQAKIIEPWIGSSCPNRIQNLLWGQHGIGHRISRSGPIGRALR